MEQTNTLLGQVVWPNWDKKKDSLKRWDQEWSTVINPAKPQNAVGRKFPIVQDHCSWAEDDLRRCRRNFDHWFNKWNSWANSNPTNRYDFKVKLCLLILLHKLESWSLQEVKWNWWGTGLEGGYLHPTVVTNQTPAGLKSRFTISMKKQKLFC